MDEGRQRLARNEAHFRVVNEKVRQLGETALSNGTRGMNILCECSSTACEQVLQVTVSEYEAVRGLSNWFFITPGHEEPDHERVVLRDDRYAVVEKLGEAAAVADQTDPRG